MDNISVICYIVAVSFIGGGNQSTWSKPLSPTRKEQVTY